MLVQFLITLISFCQRQALFVLLLATVITGCLGWYAARHLSINTDVNQMLSSDLPWRKQEAKLEKAFPQRVDTLVIVLDGQSPELIEQAASQMATALAARTDLFKTVTRPDALPFFRTNGLLFLSVPELEITLAQLTDAQPMLGTLVSDPSLRGFFGTIGMMGQGIKAGAIPAGQLQKPLSSIASSIEAAIAGTVSPLGWDSMANTKPSLRDLRKYIVTQPVLDYTQLESGQKARQVVRDTAQTLRLPEQGITARMTGTVPLNDEEFASVAEGTGMATLFSGVLVLLVLFLALRSVRIIVPILITLVMGLIATTAFSAAAVGSLNMISVAFAVMFIGIAVDFGIQFGIRFRDEYYHQPDRTAAMLNTGRRIAAPLAMAAGSTALGFFAFTPTDYRGVAELGLIAGVGMVIAFTLNVTVLPALLTLSKPPAEREAIGYLWAAPVDRFIQRFRHPILIVTAIIGCAALICATSLDFDFDPLNLKDPKTESVATMLDIIQDPDSSFYSIDLLRPSLEDAQKTAQQMEALPEVHHAITLASFIPADQDTKLALIADAAMLLAPTLSLPAQTAPTDSENKEALAKAAIQMKELGDPPAAHALATALDKAANSPDTTLPQRLHQALLSPLLGRLGQVGNALAPTPVTLPTISDDLKRDWVTADGRYLVQVYPKGDPRDRANLTAFTKAVRALAPDAAGTPISIQESGKTVTTSFLHAGLYAVFVIALLSFAVLRRVREVILLLTPLLLAGLLTLATMVIIDLPLNFANIIALPLLLSLGVSYAIYFVSYWREGKSDPLQSSMARAVLFSAMTTLVAFGTLALSTHPGTAGMGKLLTIALLYSILCTFFVLPALLGLSKPIKN